MKFAEAGRLPGGQKARANIVIVGLAIAIAAGWSSYVYGDVLSKMMSIRALALAFGGTLAFAFFAMVIRRLTVLAFHRLGKEAQPPTPGKWSSVWLSFQLACLLAVITLGLSLLLAVVIGDAERIIQALILVLVGSALLFVAGGAVRDIGRLVRIILQERK